MVEFAVAAAVLALLLLGMPVITRLHSLQLAGIEAARAAAFADSWGLSISGVLAAGPWRERLFADNAAQDQARLEAVALRYARGAPPAIAASAATVLLAPFRPLQLAGGHFDLAAGVQHRAEFSAAVAWPEAAPEPFASMVLTFNEHYELQGEQWAGAGPSQVASRVSGLLVPPGTQSLRPLMGLATGALSLVEPAWRHFCPGLVDPEIVPGDRLRPFRPGAFAGNPRTAWRAPC